MTFDEIPLYEAVHDAYLIVESPRSDRWLTTDAEQLCRAIQESLPIGHPYQMAQMLAAWAQYGKSQTVGEHKKMELLILVAKTHGHRCFWAHRGKGPCDGKVSIDRLIPETRGGVYSVENCVLACSFHNTQRHDQPMEDYLISEWTVAGRKEGCLFPNINAR